jgi:hypothetical protein
MDSPRNGKPAARRGRKVMGLQVKRVQTARLPKGFFFQQFCLFGKEVIGIGVGNDKLTKAG